jgi:acetoacetyl-CoA synthetase
VASVNAPKTADGAEAPPTSTGDGAARKPDEAGGRLLWAPAAGARSSTRVGQYLKWLERERHLFFADYDALWRWSVDELEAFWQSLWDYFEIGASQELECVLRDREMPGADWFPGARLNYAEHALRGDDDTVVVISRSQTRDPTELTRGELRARVARARAGLQRLGVQPGDRVAAYAPNIEETLIALLAVASLGATWVVCAPEFGTPAVLDRLRQVEPKVLIAVDGYRHGDRGVDRAAAVREILAALPSVEAVVRIPYLHDSVDQGLDGTTWEQLLAHDAEPAYAPVAFDHPLWILFSSGTTGLPKAIVHGHGGITLELMKSHALHSDLGPGDRWLFFSPTGWVVWNLLVSGLLVGASIVLWDGNPAYPDAAGLWRALEETRATAFGCGATFLMLSRAAGLTPGVTFDLSQLRGISSTGSPLPPEGFEWVYEHVGTDLYLQSASGGTDVSTGFVGGSPLLPVRAGRIACRYLGVDARAVDPEGRELIGELGELVICQPMPSMPVSFWNDPPEPGAKIGPRYHSAYFDQYPGRWRHGDWIRVDADGSCVVTGRSDATLNRGGVRLGTSEFYAALDHIQEVTDSLVVHLEDPAGGLGELLLFAALRDEATLNDELSDRIRSTLRSRLSPRHVPDRIVDVPGIPYNLTGKKLEVPVKRLLQGADRASVLSEGAVRDPTTLVAFERYAHSIAAEQISSPR